MINGEFIRTRYEWLDLLSVGSPAIAKLNLKASLPDQVYATKGQPPTNKDAFNFAGSEPHNAMICSAVEQLSAKGVPEPFIRKLIGDLLGKNTYGTFCEIAAYSFILEGNHDFEVQVPVSGFEILNPKGSDLDGFLRLPEEVYFDVKAFGFHEHLINLLVDRLSLDFSPRSVVAGESWDVSIDLLEGLLGRDYQALKNELANTGTARRDVISFDLRSPARVQISSRVVDHNLLASENANYMFRFAKQFARHKPFLLLFVTHPWLGGLSLHTNFHGSVDHFTKAFAHAAFNKFLNDQTRVFGMTRSDASQLVSGIVFVDAWAGNPSTPAPQHRLYLNPNAKNGLTPTAAAAFAIPYRAAISVDSNP